MVEELARLGGFERLRDFGVPEEDLPAVAEAAAARAGNQNNPRPATPGRDRGPSSPDLPITVCLSSALAISAKVPDVTEAAPDSTCS